MKTSSAKAKGRALTILVRDAIHKHFPKLLVGDVQVASAGQNGEDVILSPAARKLLPISIECKNKASFAVYKDYEQAISNANHNEPVLVIKQNRSKPLVVIDLDYYLRLESIKHDKT